MNIHDVSSEFEDYVYNEKKSNILIGPNVYLKSCKISINVPIKGFDIFDTKLEDCNFITKCKLKNVSWNETQLIRTKFLGIFESNDFGCWKKESDFGFLGECDFSEAILDGCRFFNCDLSNISFPSNEKCVTVLKPHANINKMNYENHSTQIEILIKTYEQQPSELKALSHYIPSLAKRLKIEQDLLMEFFSEFDFVV